MDAPLTFFLVAVALVALAHYLSWTATRLDRLHARCDTAVAALDAALLRRSSAVTALATSGALDPVTSTLLVDVAQAARVAHPSGRELAESDLSRALRAVLDDPDAAAEVGRDPRGAALLAELDEGCRRVVLARTFHNDAVRATRTIRRRRTVRWLRLAGRARRPTSFDMDDAPPAGLVRAG